MKLFEIESEYIPSYSIVDFVESIHGKPEDFEEGDIVERIEQYDYYQLKTINIDSLDLTEHDVDEEYVDELVDNYQNNSHKMTPIVYDPKEKSIIDGIHRANAYSKLGFNKISAYVGMK